MKPIDVPERLGRWSSGRGPLYVLLAAALRRLIDDGELPAGCPLPTDRALAAALAVGRGTVVAAYDLLHGEGRIARRQGSGTRVAGPAGAPPPDTTGAPIFLHLLEPAGGVLPLACAAPDRPPPAVAEAYAAVLPVLAATAGDIGYHPAGHPALRRAIADRFTARGLPTAPDRVLVTNGAQQALSLLARAFLRPGDRVLVEAPTYPGALEVLREAAAVPRALPVGLAGLAAAARAHRPALAYLVPTCHNPTGAVLPDDDRRALVAAAAAAGVPLVADEVPADLLFPGQPAPRPLDGDGVITVGSLSKVVWGGLRVGWVRAPAAVVGRLARLRTVHDLGGDLPAQLAAAELLPRLDELARARAADLRRGHDRLRAELARRLPGWHAPAVPGGQTLWVRLPRGDGGSFAQAAARHGVALLPGAGLDVTGGGGPYLRVPFTLPPDELVGAVARLAAAWAGYDPPVQRVASPPPLAV